MKTYTKRAPSWAKTLAALALASITPIFASAAGILTPVGSPQQPLRLESHHVDVVINNGFARTEVEQVFFNPNAQPVEAVYTTPIPEHGALSELTIWVGERALQGEVVAKEDADRIYEEEKAAGNDAGKATKDSYQRFEFNVAAVPANDRVRMRYLYYEPLPIDTGVGRYTYRLEEGGTDDEAEAFWTLDDVVASDVSIDVELKSAWPVAKTRTPNFPGTAVPDDATGALRYHFDAQGGQLNQDFVFYYMLEENLPGRLEMLTYREDQDKPGTFMMVLTPGDDLKALEGGADFAFVLDVSGSMQGKLHTLIAGVKKAIGQLKPEDRFRIITFNTSASDVSGGWRSASSENVQRCVDLLDRLTSGGSTNVYEGVQLGLSQLDADRVSSLILVTDGVTNQGIVDPAKFYALLHGQDVRFFGFLLGNSSNWPLMQLMGEASGGYYRSVSNNDDIIGEILLAKNKIVRESLHDAQLSIDGVKTFDVSDFRLGKIHYGQQLILFGRYEKSGPAKVVLTAKVSGQEKRYETETDFPEVDISNPELERMWALDQVEKIDLNQKAGFVREGEAKQAIKDLGVAYQIVTDETSMIALDDDAFARRGIDRRNQRRIAREVAAEQASAAQPQTANGAKRVDGQKPMFSHSAPSFGGGGGGAVEPWMVCFVAAGALVWVGVKRSRQRSRSSAIALFLLGGIAVAAGVSTARADDGAMPRWTDRKLDAGFGETSSIDHSIAAFWEVSEEAARVEPARPDRVPVVVERTRQPSRCGYEQSVAVCPTSPDTRTLHQTRTRSGSDGHFGINLFNAIPVIDFVWGDKRQSESDDYAGTLRR